MNEDYRDLKVKELRDQLSRFAPKQKKLEQAALAAEGGGIVIPKFTYHYQRLAAL